MEVGVTFATAIALAWSVSRLVEPAAKVYEAKGPVYGLVSVLSSGTPLSPDGVVASMVGGILALVTLSCLHRLDRIPVVVTSLAVSVALYPELQAVGRVLGAVSNSVWVTVGLFLTTFVAGVLSKKLDQGTNYDDRSGLTRLLWYRFDRVVQLLYIIVLGWVGTVVFSYTRTVRFDLTTVVAAAVTILGITVFLWDDRNTTILVVGLDDDLAVPYVVSGLYGYVKKESDGFDAENSRLNKMIDVGEDRLREKYTDEEYQFGFTRGNVLRKAIVVEVKGITVDSGNTDSLERGHWARLTATATRLSPDWLGETTGEFHRCLRNRWAYADILLFVTDYPKENRHIDRLITEGNQWSGQLDPSTACVLTHASVGVPVTEWEDDERQIAVDTARKRLTEDTDEFTMSIVPVDRSALLRSESGNGGFERLIGEL